MVVEGDFDVEKALRLTAKGRADQGGGQVSILVVLGFALPLLGVWLGAGLGLPMGAFAGGVVGLAIFFLSGNRLVRRMQLKTLRERGMPLHLPLRVELGQDALLYRLGDLAISGAWRSMHRLQLTAPSIVFYAQGTPISVPRELFADAAAERLFLSGALDRMSEEARARSEEAVKYVGVF